MLSNDLSVNQDEYQSGTSYQHETACKSLIKNRSILAAIRLIALIQTPRLPTVCNVPLPAPFVFQVLVFERGRPREFVLDQLDFEKLLQVVNLLASFL